MPPGCCDGSTTNNPDEVNKQYLHCREGKHEHHFQQLVFHVRLLTWCRQSAKGHVGYENLEIGQKPTKRTRPDTLRRN